MREIKFRSFHKEEGIMKYWDWKNPSLALETGKLFSFSGLIVMQFTGLYDRNGKEVWEGDVIRYINNDGIKRVGYVEWFEEEACFYLNSFPVWEQTEKEVIGNIYQNPELLEEK